MLLGNDGQIVTIDSDDESAIAQVMITPVAKRIKRVNSDLDGYGGNSNNSSMCRELINTLGDGYLA